MLTKGNDGKTSGAQENLRKRVDKNIAIYRPASPPRVSKVVAEVLRTLGKCIATSASGER